MPAEWFEFGALGADGLELELFGLRTSPLRFVRTYGRGAFGY